MSADLLDTTTVDAVFATRHGLDDAARAILGRTLYAVLATENADGTAHVAPLMFLFDGEEILVETGAATRKARNVEARGRASVLVQTPEASWVLGSGPARVVGGPESRRLNEGIRGKYLTAAGEEACGRVLADVDDVTIVVTPERWLAWDVGGLMAAFAAGGADMAQAGAWFRTDEG